MIEMYALLTEQGTAASETALCDYHLDDPACVERARQGAGADVSGDFVKVTDNDALACIICGDSVATGVRRSTTLDTV